MAAVSLLISLAMAGVLLWSGLEKYRTYKNFSETTRALGVGCISSLSPFVLGGVEISCALGWAFFPGSLWVQFTTLALALMFAGVAVWVLQSGKRISCNCFGTSGSGYLGKAQLVALFPWFGCVAFVHLFPTPPALNDAGSGVAKLAIVALLIASIRSVALYRAVAVSRGDRLSAEEMYAWLR